MAGEKTQGLRLHRDEGVESTIATSGGPMLCLPQAFQVLIQAFSPGFTRPSFRRFAWLTVSAIVVRAV